MAARGCVASNQRLNVWTVFSVHSIFCARDKDLHELATKIYLGKQ